MTPRECANLQGFPKSYNLTSVSESQIYKQIGNSVSVSVIERLATQIKMAMKNKIKTMNDLFK